MMRAALILLLACFNFSFPASAADVETLDDLLAKVTSAYGGGTARLGPKAVRQTGVTYSNMRRMEGRIMRAFLAPDRLRIEIQYPDTEELRILNGPHAWKREQQMSQPFRDAQLLQAVRMALPWNLLQSQSQLRDLGIQKHGDGQMLHMLELPMGDSLVIKVGIEPESGRIVRSLGSVAGSMGVMEFGTAYEDFRTQDGRLYAATERHFVAGQPTGHTRIEHVEFLDTLPEDLFIPPGPEAKSRQHT
jgi:hypothetical protein